MLDTEIVGYGVRAVELPLPRPFETARGRREVARNLLVNVELAGGAVGTGEVSPTFYVTGEDLDGTRALLQASGDLFLGEDAANYRRLSNAFRAAHPDAPSARAGIEMAVLDAYCRKLGISLGSFFGGALSELRSDVTVPIVPPDEAREIARQACAEGFTDLKVKIGSGDQDFERTVAVAQGAPGAAIRIDGNQGFTPDEAVSLVLRILDAGVNVVLFEQPVRRRDLAGLHSVRERVPVPVAADESVLSAQDAYRVAQAGAADVVNIKLMKAGVLGALEIIGVCRAAGIRLMLGCMLETRIGISVAAHLAAGTGAFEFLDLDGHILTGDTLTAGGFEQSGGRIVPSSEPGHGVRVLA